MTATGLSPLRPSQISLSPELEDRTQLFALCPQLTPWRLTSWRTPTQSPTRISGPGD